MSMDTEFIGKCVDMASNVSKLAANVTSPKPNTPKPAEKAEENMNQPHNQLVEVKVGNADEAKKPIILKEKSETHIHHTYPENRELNEHECENDRMRIANEHEYRMRKLEFEIEEARADRAEEREREEYARRERERRREADKKFIRRMGIGIGIGTAALAGIAVYDYCTHTRRAGRNKLGVQRSGEEPVTAEGTVQ